MPRLREIVRPTEERMGAWRDRIRLQLIQKDPHRKMGNIMHVSPAVITTGAIVLRHPELARDGEKIKQIFRLVRTVQEIRRRAEMSEFRILSGEREWLPQTTSYRELKEYLAKQHP